MVVCEYTLGEMKRVGAALQPPTSHKKGRTERSVLFYGCMSSQAVSCADLPV